MKDSRDPFLTKSEAWTSEGYGIFHLQAMIYISQCLI